MCAADRSAPAKVGGRVAPVSFSSLPSPLARYNDLLSVIVTLQSVGDKVRLRLQKDHGNQNLSDLYLDLDPQTMLIVER